ncbi:ATP-grasp domain-containing protein [Streptomyces oryzae]|uniref:ATP-grasp domain-containing protein n=1 Tax=Streptomyces oryzae TaxID=1434886 RepID=A0ABS3XBV4_9ACTN|nr:ATP-grasp domain-containing protein [Streptomyces oryzae]MBO8192867.1 ATP-grasp domain-containing protein [Streptomyces oryzae]
MPSFATDVPALLLRLDPNPYHHGTLGAARSLGRAGLEVHALLGSTNGPVPRTRFLHRVHTLPRAAGRPDGSAGGGSPADAELEQALCEVSAAIGRPAVLLALDDQGAIAAARLAPRLTGRYLLPAVEPSLPARLADKAELAAVCARAGIAHPATVLPGSAREAGRAAAALGLPVVAKWSRPWLLPAGLRSTALVHTEAEAVRLFGRSEEAGSALLLQRRLPDAPGADWFFHGYAAEGGRFLAGGAGRKERAWPPYTGLTAVGRWLPSPPVEAAAARLSAALDYRGILDLDFRLDPATGVPHLVDFNPRPGAQFRLFTDGTGLDVVRAQHLHLTGRAVPETPCGHGPGEPRGAPGRVFVVENYALLAALLGPRPPGPTATGMPRGPVEPAWFAPDDPLPFAAMAAGWLGRCLGKVLRGVTPARERPVTVPRPGAADAAHPARSAHSAASPPARHTETAPHTERRNSCTTS